MTVIGIRALKQNASAVVARVAAGEIVTITDRGRPVAQMTPLGRSRLDDLIEAGLATEPSRSLADLPEPAVRAEGPRLSEVVAEMRDDERY